MYKYIKGIFKQLRNNYSKYVIVDFGDNITNNYRFFKNISFYVGKNLFLVE